MTENKKAILYTRVNNEEVNSIQQKSSIMLYAEQNNYNVIAEYNDVCSGNQLGTQLDKMIKEIEHHKVDAVLIYEPSRLSRKTDVYMSMVNLLNSKSIKVISVKQ